MRTHYCGELNAKHIGDTITVCGWVHRRRDHGGVIFLDLRDRQGLLQVVVDPDTKDAFATADRARSEWVMQITGLVRARPEGTVNADMPTGVIPTCLCIRIGADLALMSAGAVADSRLSRLARRAHCSAFRNIK